MELAIDGGSTVVVQADRPPVVNGAREERMRVGCGSAAIGMFAPQWKDHVDEVIVVDDHITGVLSEHQGGRFLDMKPAGIRVRGRKSTPGRYFQVAQPGLGWGGTDVSDPLEIIEKIDPKQAWPGLKLLMVSTTGEHSAWFELDEDLKPQPAAMPAPVQKVVERIAENCEPALCTVLFMAGAGGSLRAGVTENPVRLTRSVRDTLTKVTLGGVPAYVWPGGGITLMVDVAKMPEKSFGYVPTPALVAPIEFTLRASDYAALGGYASRAVDAGRRAARQQGAARMIAARFPDGRSASAARSDRPDRRGVRRARGSRGGLSPGRRPLRRHPADAGARAADAAPTGRRGLSAAAGAGRAPHGRSRVAASRRVHHADGRGRRRRRRRDAAGDAGRPHARQGLRQRRRRHRHPSAPGHSLRAGIFAQALDGAVDLDARPAGARHRHLGPWRPLVLAGHRRQRDRARPHRRRRRRRRDPDRQRSRHRPPRHRAPARRASSIPTATSATWPVTVSVGDLPRDAIDEALDRGLGRGPAAASPRPDRQRGTEPLRTLETGA